MKRVITIVLIVLSFFLVVDTANAMSEEELVNVMNQTFTVGNSTYKMSNSDLVLLERYLNMYDVSESDADFIAQKFYEAIAIIQESGTTNYKNFSRSTKNRLKALVEEISLNTSVKATVTKDSLVIFSPDGREVFAEVTNIVKQTGNIDYKMTIALSLSSLVLLSSAFILIRRSKMNNNA